MMMMRSAPPSGSFLSFRFSAGVMTTLLLLASHHCAVVAQTETEPEMEPATATMKMMTGYLVDKLCWSNCEGVPANETCTPDDAHVVYRPYEHTGWCMLLDFCVNSGYVLLSPEPDHNNDGKHTILLDMDHDESHPTVVSFLKAGTSGPVPLVTVEYDESNTEVVDGLTQVRGVTIRDTWATDVSKYYDDETRRHQVLCQDSTSPDVNKNNMCFRSDVVVTEAPNGMLSIESNGCPDHANMQGSSGHVTNLQADDYYGTAACDSSSGCDDGAGKGCGTCCGSDSCTACSSAGCDSTSTMCDSCSSAGCDSSSAMCDSCSSAGCDSTSAMCDSCSSAGCDSSSPMCDSCSSAGDNATAISRGADGVRFLQSATTESCSSANCSSTSCCSSTTCCSAAGGDAGCCSSTTCCSAAGGDAGCCSSATCCSAAGGDAGCCGSCCSAVDCSGCTATNGQGHGSSKPGPYSPMYQHYRMLIPQNPSPPGDAKYFSESGNGEDVVGILANGVLLDSHKATWSYDSCNGHSDKKHQYHYHIPPQCFLEAMGVKYPDETFWWQATNGTHVREYADMAGQWPSMGDASPIIGFALDGYPIFGPYDDAGNVQRGKDFGGDVDECNGKMDGNGNYGYYLTVDPPFAPPCLKGETMGVFSYYTTDEACPNDGIQTTVIDTSSIDACDSVSFGEALSCFEENAVTADGGSGSGASHWTGSTVFSIGVAAAILGQL